MVESTTGRLLLLGQDGQTQSLDGGVIETLVPEALHQIDEGSYAGSEMVSLG